MLTKEQDWYYTGAGHGRFPDRGGRICSWQAWGWHYWIPGPPISHGNLTNLVIQTWNQICAKKIAFCWVSVLKRQTSQVRFVLALPGIARTGMIDISMPWNRIDSHSLTITGKAEVDKIGEELGLLVEQVRSRNPTSDSWRTRIRCLVEGSQWCWSRNRRTGKMTLWPGRDPPVVFVFIVFVVVALSLRTARVLILYPKGEVE